MHLARRLEASARIQVNQTSLKLGLKEVEKVDTYKNALVGVGGKSDLTRVEEARMLLKDDMDEKGETQYNKVLSQKVVYWDPLVDKVGFFDWFAKQEEQMTMLVFHEKRGIRLIMSYLAPGPAKYWKSLEVSHIRDGLDAYTYDCFEKDPGMA